MTSCQSVLTCNDVVTLCDTEILLGSNTICMILQKGLENFCNTYPDMSGYCAMGRPGVGGLVVGVSMTLCELEWAWMWTGTSHVDWTDSKLAD